MEVWNNVYSLKGKRLFLSSRRLLGSVEAFHLHRKELIGRSSLLRLL